MAIVYNMTSQTGYTVTAKDLEFYQYISEYGTKTVKFLECCSLVKSQKSLLVLVRLVKVKTTTETFTLSCQKWMYSETCLYRYPV